MALVRFVALIIRFAFVLALAGELKSCTLELMTRSAAKSEIGIMSYSNFTRMLVGPPVREK